MYFINDASVCRYVHVEVWSILGDCFVFVFFFHFRVRRSDFLSSFISTLILDSSRPYVLTTASYITTCNRLLFIYTNIYNTGINLSNYYIMYFPLREVPPLAVILSVGMHINAKRVYL